MNLFHKIEEKAKISKQEYFEGEIVKKRRGAPRKPNMVAKKLKVDRILYQQIRDHCKARGITISSFCSIVFRKELALANTF